MTRLLSKKFSMIVTLVLLFKMVLVAQTTKDIVYGNLIQFNDNGFWCWYQDERAIVDTANNKLIVGSSAASQGFGGSSRSTANEAVIYDLQTRTFNFYTLGNNKSSSLTTDDHNAPAFEIRPDGKYITMYSDHYDKYKNRYRIFDGTTWSAEQAYDWTLRTGGTDYTIAYNNLYYLSAEGRMYNFSRANKRSPNFIISDDMGDTWTFGGQLTTNNTNSYNKGYYKYWSNGVDRIDFLFTEQHPRDGYTSIYHGYIKGGKAYDSKGTLVDEDIRDATFIPSFENFTKVFSDSTIIGSTTFRRCWQADLMRYDDGTIAAIITARTNQFFSNGYNNPPIANPEHAFIYCRYDGTQWSYTYLAKAGLKFYSSEEDYTGLGALAPNDPNTLYISTPWDPRDTSKSLGVREIFKGTTSNNGVAWSWTPITENSVRDNMRPIIPVWNKDNIVLLWCRGSYTTAQGYDAAVVGIIENKNETISKMNYVDASSANTTFADGTALVTTGPDANEGTADNQWHERTGVGNGGSVYTSSESTARGGENAPALKTNISFPKDGIYDVWVNFWANPTADWRVKAGLSETSMQTFRQMASKKVDETSHQESILLAGSDNTFLYQAYLGRVEKKALENLDVFVDDDSRSGSNNALTGNTARTWYDGISYAIMNNDLPVDVAQESQLPASFSLSQNYPNPFNPSTVIQYNMPMTDHVTLKIYDLLGREVETLVNQVVTAGHHEIRWSAKNLASGVYIYQMRTSSYSSSKKMIFQK